MVKRGVEFGLGLAGTIISGLLAIGSLIAGVFLTISLAGAGWEYYDYSNFQYGLNSIQDVFLVAFLFFAVVIAVALLIVGLISIVSFVLGLMGVIGLKKRVNEPAKREGILLTIGGALGNVFMLTSGILALSKSPDRMVHNKPDNRKLEFALGLVGSILMGVSLFGTLVFRMNTLVGSSYNYGYSYGYNHMITEAIAVFGIILAVICGGAAIALSIIGTIRIKNKKGTDNTKTEGILLLIGGILGLNAFSLSAGILALTKRGK